MKPLEALSIEDLTSHPVWRIVVRDDVDEVLLRPVDRVPVRSLADKLVSTQVTLANGASRWAMLGNVKPANPRLTRQFLTMAVREGGRWFHLARYFDVQWNTHGPDALAAFLSLPVEQVFPIEYDIRRFAAGDPAALAGVITKEPSERLSRAEIIKLAVP